MMAKKWALPRDALDDYAYHSHMRAMHAAQNGWLANQVLPIELPDGRLFVTDEGVRTPPDRARMAALKPAFKPDGVITAGNASQVSDGAAALLLASPRAVGRLNLAPLASILARVVVGSDPVLMLDGPIPATRKVLQRLGLSLDEIDTIEVNEAFACVPLAWARELGADLQKTNPTGGAIAHGHPLGATGAVLMTKLVHELVRSRGRYGLQTMCIGHGMATATIVERL
jgi:acetyl-CoA C-acetyltransferase